MKYEPGQCLHLVIPSGIVTSEQYNTIPVAILEREWSEELKDFIYSVGIKKYTIIGWFRSSKFIKKYDEVISAKELFGTTTKTISGKK